MSTTRIIDGLIAKLEAVSEFYNKYSERTDKVYGESFTNRVQEAELFARQNLKELKRISKEEGMGWENSFLYIYGLGWTDACKRAMEDLVEEESVWKNGVPWVEQICERPICEGADPCIGHLFEFLDELKWVRNITH